MQLMPSTARQYGVTNLYDPAVEYRGGDEHLKSLLEPFPAETGARGVQRR